MHELILGGGKSGKSRCAELRAKDWLRVSGQCALLIATAMPGDDEMRERIARHREQRALHVPNLQTLEVPHDLPAVLREWCAPQRLVIVDCLTVWLTQQLMPMVGPRLNEPAWRQREAALCDALGDAAGPVVLVSNEIGMVVAPLGHEVRRYLDALGALHQRVATFCERVTLMVAGIEMKVKQCTRPTLCATARCWLRPRPRARAAPSTPRCYPPAGRNTQTPRRSRAQCHGRNSPPAHSPKEPLMNMPTCVSAPTPTHIPVRGVLHQLAAAAALGFAVLYGVAFADSPLAHNAAHDVRHITVKPCH